MDRTSLSDGLYWPNPSVRSGKIVLQYVLLLLLSVFVLMFRNRPFSIEVNSREVPDSVSDAKFRSFTGTIRRVRDTYSIKPDIFWLSECFI